MDKILQCTYLEYLLIRILCKKKIAGDSFTLKPPMYKSNLAKNPEIQIAWICRLDQYSQMILNPKNRLDYWKNAIECQLISINQIKEN